MNNPADTLAALAADIERAGQTAPFILDNTAFAISPSEIDEWVSRLRALASLKGEAEPIGYLFRGCADRQWQFEEGEIPQIVTDSLDTMLVYTTPPAQPEPQPATGGEFCLICDMPSGEMAYCSTCASAGIAEAWVNRPGQSKTTPPAPQAGTAVGRLAHLLDELAKLFPEAVDPLASDPPELRYLEAIRALATQLQQAPTPSPAPQGGGVAVTPAPNWCRTCGKHRSDPMAAFCRDPIHIATPPAQQPGEVVTDEMVEAAEKERVRSLNAITAYGSAGVEERHLMAMRLDLTAALAPKEK